MELTTVKKYSDLLDDLTFANYRHNRGLDKKTPERWATIYGSKVFEYEKIIATEEANENNKPA